MGGEGEGGKKAGREGGRRGVGNEENEGEGEGIVRRKSRREPSSDDRTGSNKTRGLYAVLRHTACMSP